MAIENLQTLKGDDDDSPQYPRKDLRKMKEITTEMITPRNRAERRLAKRQQRKRGR